MGTLDKSTGSGVKRHIKTVDITGKTAAQIETEFNTNWGPKGWRIIQILVIGTKTYLLAEKEI
jgi:hypothetical protein